jgi:hypothetical protein
LAAVLLLAMRLLVEAGFVDAELLDADEAFFLETRLFPLRGFSLPVTVSTNAVTALDAISFAAAMFILAASVSISGTDVISPSFSLSIFTSLPASGRRHKHDEGSSMSLSQINQAPPQSLLKDFKKEAKACCCCLAVFERNFHRLSLAPKGFSERCQTYRGG